VVCAKTLQGPCYKKEQEIRELYGSLVQLRDSRQKNNMEAEESTLLEAVTRGLEKIQQTAKT
jgi:hypothetical protein